MDQLILDHVVDSNRSGEAKNFHLEPDAVARPLRKEIGAWQKTMEPQKPGNSPQPGPEIVERQRVCNKLFCAEGDERCPGLDNRRHCTKDSRGFSGWICRVLVSLQVWPNLKSIKRLGDGPFIRRRDEMSQGDSYGMQRRLREKKWNNGGLEAAGDGATSRSVKTTQLGNVAYAEERKPSESNTN